MRKTILFLVSLLALIPLILYAWWPEAENVKNQSSI